MKQVVLIMILTEMRSMIVTTNVLEVEMSTVLVSITLAAL